MLISDVKILPKSGHSMEAPCRFCRFTTRHGTKTLPDVKGERRMEKKKKIRFIVVWLLITAGVLAGSLLVMMGLAFVLSLCSSSDAVVARSFSNSVPTGAVMGFLVFGPMLDIKNVIMLSGSLPRRFLLRLGLTIFLVDLVVLFLAFHFGLGVFLG